MNHNHIDDIPVIKERPSWAPFFVYISIILISFLAFYPSFYQSSLAIIEAGGFDQLSPFMFTLLSLIQPFIISVVCLLLGHFMAYKVDLDSVVYQYFESLKKARNNFLLSLKPAVISGAVYGLIIVAFDLLLRPWLPEVFQQSIQAPVFIEVIGRIFYGGVVEEIILRFGLMTLLIHLISFGGRKLSKWKVIFVIVFQAMIFALGHLPATSMAFEMTPIIWSRMIIFNGLGGVLFGWLYYRYHLEAAIISHMSTHISAAILTTIIALF